MRGHGHHVEGTRAGCEGEQRPSDGTIHAPGCPDLAPPPSERVVTGGTERGEGVSGTEQSTLSDLPGASLLTIHL